ncbi:MAG: glycoside hydrolase family 75 protein [Sphingomicrobium sp.]
MTFDGWTHYCGVALWRHASGAYRYTTDHLALDADGSLFAYHPDNLGRDDLRFASWPSGAEDWRWILVADADEPSRPWVQREGPAKGYFLSMTTLRDPHGAATDPATYVDSEAIPYLVFPANFLKIDGVGGFGDVAMARNLRSGEESWAVVADQGPAPHPLGEVSLRLAEALGGRDLNPRNGDGIAPGPYEYLIFPNSRLDPPWPRSATTLRRQAEARFAAIGGWGD